MFHLSGHRHVPIAIIASLVSILVSSASLAGGHLWFNRTDQNVPSHCQNLEVKDFSGPIETVLFSIDGAIEAGFTHEYPQGRDAMNVLWKIFRDDLQDRPNIRHRLRHFPNADRDFEIILNNIDIMGFDFGSEGEVLELVALVALETEYSPEKYFLTGGLQYSQGNSSTSVLGELDVVIGDRITCKIVAIGEAKLGIHRVRKAREQLQRFRSFIKKNLRH